MNRRHFLHSALALAAGALARPALADAGVNMPNDTDQAVQRLTKSKAEWRRLLPAPAYEVLFEEHTERSGTSPLNAEKREGTFVCAACFLPLFTSVTKFESGTGWPSFYDAIPGHRGTKRSATPLLQKRLPVGGGPSLNTCPWWPPHRAQWYSVRGRIILKSRLVPRWPGIAS